MKVCAAAIASLFVSQCGAFTAPSFSAKYGATTTLSAATLDAPVAAADDKSKIVNGEAAIMDAPVASSAEEEKEWQVAEAPDDSIEPGRYADLKRSIALPFLPRPTALDGSHAGDFGFDPLGFSEQFDLYTMQEAEVRHARLAMLAVVGWPLSELVAPDWMLQHGCAPSVLNGFNPVSFLATAAAFGAIGFFEYKTSLRSKVGTTFGEKHKKDMSQIWDLGVAGDYNFDPLNLYSVFGDDYKSRKGLREVEISHGRSAMLGITAFAMWEFLTGHPIVENSMFFHPNLLLPALAVGYVAWNEIYEITPLNEYPIQIQYKNEGEMKLERLQQAAAQAQSSMEKNIKFIQEKDEQYGGVIEKALAAPGKAIDAARSTYKYW
mmetsp:Transcript_17596/g.24252  ORF Transcript_17596/g.24252 Transcript_17596/m.24252 type:complete len:378 (-) Transcript_17596:80-1213(-)|eukprot:CAMPEP_0185723136 /NCGR_PEP_ID=MMETSP1171-20130828/72_1 /TAXON_ID=374046 /ORGANISM="Helicotheca tamensis, Strain CCMP826" /LENGTH=377 /DNA_ID=CAMNT_0028390801 /DNA_START=47 /DNA_END=1180 /DNA_ORIENTATION=-